MSVISSVLIWRGERPLRVYVAACALEIQDSQGVRKSESFTKFKLNSRAAEVALRAYGISFINFYLHVAGMRWITVPCSEHQ